MASLVNVLDPQIIVVGGSFSKASKLIMGPAKKAMKNNILSSESEKYVKIELAKLGDFAGAIGAALLFL